MKDDKRITQNDIEQAEVRLGPVFGVRPGHYLAAIYGIALALGLFALLILPGIAKNGAYYRFAMDPPDAAVYVDGAYRVSGDRQTFLAAGKRTVLIRRDGFEDASFQIEVRGRLFGSLFFPKRVTMPLRMASSDPLGILVSAMLDYSAWALAGAPSEAYQHPMALSEAARAWSGSFAGTALAGTALADTALADARIDSLAGFMPAAISYASSAPAVRDALRAGAIAYGASATVTPGVLGRMVERVIADIEASPAVLAAVIPYLPAGARASLEGSAFYSKLRASLADEPAAPRATGTLKAAGMDFIMLPAGDYALGAARGELQAFGLARAETTVAQFREFLAQNPAWDRAARAELAGRGLVDSDYLNGMDDDDGLPVRWVSRHAALAYCDWLSARAPAGWRFTLPSEAQWAYAAAAGKPQSGIFAEQGRTGPAPIRELAQDGAGFLGLLGNVWEWCADSFAFAPVGGLLDERPWLSAEGTVRGGSWANKAGGVDLSSRGAVRPSSCTPFLGFRVAMVESGD